MTYPPAMTFLISLKIKVKSDTWMENIIELLSWTWMEKLGNWRMKNKFDWATSPTNVNAFHTFQANAISEYSCLKVHWKSLN